MLWNVSERVNCELLSNSYYQLYTIILKHPNLRERGMGGSFTESGQTEKLDESIKENFTSQRCPGDLQYPYKMEHTKDWYMLGFKIN